MSRTGTTITALAGAAILIVIAAWFDTTVVREALVQGAATFDAFLPGAAFALGSLLVAGSALAVWVLARRAQSAVVGLAYAVVGGVLAALPWLGSYLPAGTDDPTSVLEPLLAVLREVHVWTLGPLHAVSTIGAAMLISGVAVLIRGQRHRTVAQDDLEPMSPATDPTIA